MEFCVRKPRAGVGSVPFVQQDQTLQGVKIAVAIHRSSHIVRQADLFVIITADNLKFIAGLVRFIVGGNQLLDAELSKAQLK